MYSVLPEVCMEGILVGGEETEQAVVGHGVLTGNA